MGEKKYYALQVLRVEGIANRPRDAGLYVEVKFGKSVRKTGVLNAEGEPNWNTTMTFSQFGTPNMFTIRLKKATKLHDALIGQTEVEADKTSAICVQICTPTPSRLLLDRARQNSTCSVHIILKDTDELNRARIEVEAADKSAERIRAMTTKLNSTVEIIGNLVEVTDAMVDIVDNVVQINPILNVSWQAAAALYKLISLQFHADAQLVELVDKIRMAFNFSTEARNLDDRTEVLKPLLKELLKETAECSRFVQKYSERSFIGRMLRVGNSQKISDYVARFVDLRKELDSFIALNTTREVFDINLLQQLEAFLDPPRSDPSNVSSRPRCLEGARQEYLDPIMEFLFVQTSPNILWLTGAAGTGKSTIAVTASDRCCSKGHPPAYIFFERQKSDPASVIRSIAYSVATLHPSVGRAILAILEVNKTIRGTTAQNQFEMLLLGPLHATVDSVEGPIILILDALDECGDPEQRRDLLRLMKTDFSKLPSKVRILITSRPLNDLTRNLASRPHIRQVGIEHGDELSRREVAS